MNTGHHSFVAAFSSNRKDIQRTGALLLFADVGEPQGSQGSLGHRSCIADLTMTGREILWCRAAYEDQPCASVLMSTLQYLPNLSFVLLSLLFPIFQLITAGLLRLQWNTITKKLVRANRRKKKTNNEPTNKNLSL